MIQLFVRGKKSPALCGNTELDSNEQVTATELSCPHSYAETAILLLKSKLSHPVLVLGGTALGSASLCGFQRSVLRLDFPLHPVLLEDR